MSCLCMTSTMFMCLLLITCFCTNSLTEFPRTKHIDDTNGVSTAFLVIGDWGRNGMYNQSEVAAQMGNIGKELEIKFVISTGDNFYPLGIRNISDPLFRNSFTRIYTAKSLQKPWYSVLGNHDYMGNAVAQLSPKLKDIDQRWNCVRNFIVQAGPVDIFFIDTTPFVNKYFSSEMEQKYHWRGVLPRQNYLTYVRNCLKHGLNESKANWKIVVGHHTIRSIGRHGDTRELVDQILPILEANKVDMYMNGHDHCLQHISNKKGTMQFLTSGGGSRAWEKNICKRTHDSIRHFYYAGQGFMSVKINLESAFVVFYDVFGKHLHEIQLKPRNGKKTLHKCPVTSDLCNGL